MSILDEAVALAGTDPRPLHARLMAGRPEQMLALARAFDDAGQEARAAYEQGRRAHDALAGGFTDDGTPVLDAAAQTGQAWRLLGQGGQDMADTATFLKRSVTALDQAQAGSTRVVTRMVADLDAVAATAARQTAPDPAGAAALRRQYLTRAAGIVTAAARDVQQTIDAYDHELTGYTGGLAARGYVPSPTPSPQATTSDQKHWWESALDTAGDIGAAVYDHTVVPAVNTAADLAQAAVEHPGDVAGLLLGGALVVLGGAGEIGGGALDLTGVGAVAGVPVNVAAAGVIAAGVGIAAMSAGDLGSNAARNDDHVLDEAQGPSDTSGTSSSGAPTEVDKVLDGLPEGRSSGVRTVGSDAELGQVYGTLSRDGTPIDVPGYNGTWVERPDGVRVGLRNSSKSGGRTIDIRYPDGTTGKVHVQ